MNTRQRQELLSRLICPWHIHPCCPHITHNDSAMGARKAIAAGEDLASLRILLPPLIEFFLGSLHLNGHIRHKLMGKKSKKTKKQKRPITSRLHHQCQLLTVVRPTGSETHLKLKVFWLSFNKEMFVSSCDHAENTVTSTLTPFTCTQWAPSWQSQPLGLELFKTDLQVLRGLPSGLFHCNHVNVRFTNATKRAKLRPEKKITPSQQSEMMSTRTFQLHSQLNFELKSFYLFFFILSFKDDVMFSASRLCFFQIPAEFAPFERGAGIGGVGYNRDYELFVCV